MYVSQDSNILVDQSVQIILKEEEEFGLKNISTYLEFRKKIENLKTEVVKKIKILKEKYSSIIGYGAPAKATTALNFFNINKEIDYIIEDNKLKHGKYIPGVNIKIVPKEEIKNKDQAILVLAWNFFDEIKKNNKDLKNNFISIKNLEK